MKRGLLALVLLASVLAACERVVDLTPDAKGASTDAAVSTTTDAGPDAGLPGDTMDAAPLDAPL